MAELLGKVTGLKGMVVPCIFSPKSTAFMVVTEL
jgi:hypothetical protein